MAKDRESRRKTFADLAADYLEKKISARSKRRAEFHLKHILPFFGGMKLASIDEDNIERYKAKRSAEFVQREGGDSKTMTKGSTINRETALIRGALLWAVERKWLKSAPKIDRYDESSLKRQRTLTVEEYEAFMKAADAVPWFNRFSTAGFEACLTRGDAINLKWDQVLWHEGVIKIKRRKSGMDQLVWTSPPLRRVLMECLTEFKKLPNTANLVFTIDGRPIKITELQREHRRACRAAKIEDFRLHDWRHVSVTKWAASGVPEQFQRIASGHTLGSGAHATYLNPKPADIVRVFSRTWKPYDLENFGHLDVYAVLTRC